MREQVSVNENDFLEDDEEGEDFILSSDSDDEDEEEDEDTQYLADDGEAGENSIRSEFRDLSLKEEAGETLAFHEDIDASSIALEVRNGVVTLMGSVNSESEKIEAADCLSEMDEVVDVINDLIVQ